MYTHKRDVHAKATLTVKKIWHMLLLLICVSISQISYAQVELTLSEQYNTESLDAAVAECYKPLLGFDNGWFKDTYNDVSVENLPLWMIELGCYPTWDIQTSGGNGERSIQNIELDCSDIFWFRRILAQFYKGIVKCNGLLNEITISKSMENGFFDQDFYNQIEGQGRALRAFYYFWLATNFGKVPILNEDTSDNTTKESPEIWDYIISEFRTAADLLSWKANKYNYECRKGMALAYLADAYMWKAHLTGDSSFYKYAKEALEEVINSGEYALMDSYSILWDFIDGYDKDPREYYPYIFDDYNTETIFQIALYEGKGGRYDELNGTHNFSNKYWSPIKNGGWTGFNLSWELYDSFEIGDKRRDASMVPASLSKNVLTRLGKSEWEQCYIRKSSDSGSYCMGYNGYTREDVEEKELFTYTEYINLLTPNVYSIKHWRYGPDRYYLKRYANVLLDYAECCFLCGEEDKGWEYINKIRTRAFGNNEVPYSNQTTENDLAKRYKNYLNYTLSRYYDNADEFPYPYSFSSSYCVVPDAKEYYASLKEAKGFDSPVWKVAVNEERRKEFNAESCLRGDLQRSGYLSDHLAHNYSGGTEEWRSGKAPNIDNIEIEFYLPSDLDSIISIMGNCQSIICSDSQGNKYRIYNGLQQEYKASFNKLSDKLQNTTSFTIPDKVSFNGKVYTVKEVDDSAFIRCSSMENVVLPNEINYIGHSAFKDCSSLKSIQLPNEINYIGHSAFKDCSSLKSIQLPNSVNFIGEEAFFGCSSLVEINIPKLIKSIGASTFYGCKSLKSVILHDLLIEIRDKAFSDCSSLISIDIPSSVTKIGLEAFSGCSSLESVTLHDSLIEIKDKAFLNCSSLKSIDIPSSVTELGEYVFSGCTTLERANVNATISVLLGTFKNCKSLKAITLPSTLTSIREEAFYNCSSLERFFIPSNFWNIDPYYNPDLYPSFYGCVNLKVIINASKLQIVPGAKTHGYIAYYATTVYQADDVTESGFLLNKETNSAYSVVGYLGEEKDLTIPNNYQGKPIINIGDKAFYGYASLRSLVMPNTLTSIGEYSFAYCKSLTSVEIPNSVKRIGSSAFRNCTNLSSITIGENVESMGHSVFASCKSLFSAECEVSPFYFSITPKIGNISGIDSLFVSDKDETVEIINGQKVKLQCIPNTFYGVTVIMEKGDKFFFVFDDIFEGYTPNVELDTSEPIVTNQTTAILVAETNLGDETENTGFEWRRYDAPDIIRSNIINSSLDKGVMMGALSNLNPNVYYKYRPFVKDPDDDYHYGEWMGLFTGDANVFVEPIVRSYMPDFIDSYNAILKGYIMQGTDEIVDQGFEFWESYQNTYSEKDKVRITVNGERITYMITDLSPKSNYCYRTFVVTKNSTYYGDIISFSTPEFNGIFKVIDDVPESGVIVGYYDINGVFSLYPHKGINIIRYLNGCTKKIYVP